MYEEHSAFDRERTASDGYGLRHSNPIALLILAEWVEKRDHEDTEVEHGFSVMRGH